MSDAQFRKQLLDRYRNCKPPVTPPECQGQMVEYSYTSDGEYIFVRYTDKCEQETSVWAYDFPSDLFFEPWNCIPVLTESHICDDAIFVGPIGGDR